MTTYEVRDGRLVVKPRRFDHPNPVQTQPLIIPTHVVDAIGVDRLTAACTLMGYSWLEVRPLEA